MTLPQLMMLSGGIRPDFLGLLLSHIPPSSSYELATGVSTSRCLH